MKRNHELEVQLKEFNEKEFRKRKVAVSDRRKES